MMLYYLENRGTHHMQLYVIENWVESEHLWRPNGFYREKWKLVTKLEYIVYVT